MAQQHLAASMPRDRMSPAEWAARVDLAACYRAVAHFGWDDLISTHISARLPDNPNHFLINPFGLMFEEITASSLIKIDIEGNKIDDTSPYDINPAGYVIHSAIHAAVPDAHCVVHLHSPDGVAVSIMEDGLMALEQTSIGVRANLAFHEFEGPALNLEEQERLRRDLGTKHSMLLRNHGTLTVGSTIAEAFMRMYALERACTTQVRALSAGQAGIHHPPDSAIADMARMTNRRSEILESYYSLAWAALLRMLDRKNPGYAE